jgi:transcriptional regulator with XRE-family HTH domain
MPRKSQFKLPKLPLGTESFGRRFARLRKQKGFTQVELAEKIGIIQALISDYEHDKIRPHAEMVARFALALDVSADELLGIERSAHQDVMTKNRRLLRRIRQIDSLPKRDQEALLRTIDAFLAKAS